MSTKKEIKRKWNYLPTIKFQGNGILPTWKPLKNRAFMEVNILYRSYHRWYGKEKHPRGFRGSNTFMFCHFVLLRAFCRTCVGNMGHVGSNLNSCRFVKLCEVHPTQRYGLSKVSWNNNSLTWKGLKRVLRKGSWLSHTNKMLLSRWLKVTFWSHSWRSRFAFERVTYQSQKGHQQNCQEFSLFGEKFTKSTSELNIVKQPGAHSLFSSALEFFVHEIMLTTGFQIESNWTVCSKRREWSHEQSTNIGPWLFGLPSGKHSWLENPHVQQEIPLHSGSIFQLPLC